jgi:hypothetical protein
MILRVKYMNFKAKLNILQEKDEDTSQVTSIILDIHIYSLNTILLKVAFNTITLTQFLWCSLLRVHQTSIFRSKFKTRNQSNFTSYFRFISKRIVNHLVLQKYFSFFKAPIRHRDASVQVKDDWAVVVPQQPLTIPAK